MILRKGFTDKIIVTVDAVKFLGVHIDSYLNYRSEPNEVVSIISSIRAMQSAACEMKSQ